MGFLISDKQFTVPYGGSIGNRTFLAGVNKDVTPEMADHWYARAAGAQYVEKLEDAHKASPAALASVRAARAQWEQAMRESVRAHGTQLALRKDLEKLEKEFGVDSKKADKEFEAASKDEMERVRVLHEEAMESARAQAELDANEGLSPAEAERKAAGSAEVANTEMDGPARAEAEKTAVETAATMVAGAPGNVGTPAAPVTQPPVSTVTERAAAGSDEAVNTSPSTNQPVRAEDKREEPKPGEVRKADEKDAKDGKTEAAEANQAAKEKAAVTATDNTGTDAKAASGGDAKAGDAKAAESKAAGDAAKAPATESAKPADDKKK